MSGRARASNKSIEQQYRKVTAIEHVLIRPDTYIGSIQKVTQPMWVFSDDDEKIVQKNITFVPGLYKVFDEILVNAADNRQRDSTMTSLKVVIDPQRNYISVWNNGKGIPVAVHSEHNIYVPELIFGHLLTSSNYDDNEKKVTGGRNGYGAKLANIFSREFTVEAADVTRGKLYRQSWRNNMSDKEEAEITAFSGSSDYTMVSFRPDLARFGMDANGLDSDIVSLLKKRVYDMAGVLGSRGVLVFLNGTRISCKTFSDYVSLYSLDNVSGTDGNVRVWERINDRWEVCCSISDGSFGQVSFVNAICTTKGGQHVNYIADQIAQSVADHANRGNKGVDVKPQHVKNYMLLFVNCLIENPAFDSQTKDTLTTRPREFGSEAAVSDKFMKQILSTGIVDRVLSLARFRAQTELQRASGGKTGRKVRMLDIPKLDDANFAGTSRGRECTLILTEGDSAKSLAIAGLSVVGRDFYGVFPLKGKLLNVREASHKSITANAEIQNIVRIMGLEYGKKYTDTKGLRYGHLMIMADQDHDGSHIKGLVLNFLHHFWPTLLSIPGFLKEFITPIVKAVPNTSTLKKLKKAGTFGNMTHTTIQNNTPSADGTLTFFTLPEYTNWKRANSGTSGYQVKYYKGLGTSTAAEAKSYFSDLDLHALTFEMDNPEETGEDADNLINLAFSKKRADDRKQWLMAYQPGSYVDYGVDKMLVSEFVHKELILFSVADNIRSIPSLVDGLKPAQRKVLFACFKRNLKQDIKVAQLAGYVSEHAAYHHGEASLNSTITGMAQDFVGSNNVPLLVPSGQFGTRLMGGQDAASARYIFTRLSPITRLIFHPDDDKLLSYLDDDGVSIEPEYYLPIIPLILVNGAEGIGTGWSTSIPNHNPLEIIQILKKKIRGEYVGNRVLTPWYRGFRGVVQPAAMRVVANATATQSTHNNPSAVSSEDENGDIILSSQFDATETAPSQQSRAQLPYCSATFQESNTSTQTSIVTSWTTRGIAALDEALETMTITELPIGKWTSDYKSLLVELLTGVSQKDKDAAAATTAGRGKGAKKATAAGKKTTTKKAANKTTATTKKTAGAKKDETNKKTASKSASEDALDSEAEVGNEDSDYDEDGPTKKKKAAKTAPPKPAKRAAAKKVAKTVSSDDEDDFFSGGESGGNESDFEVEPLDDDEDDDEVMDVTDLPVNTKKGGAKKTKEKSTAIVRSRAVSEKEMLASLLPQAGEPLILDFQENHTDTNVHFTLKVAPAAQNLIKTCTPGLPPPDGNGHVSSYVRKVFALETRLSTGNMNLFDARGRIRKYNTAMDIVDEFYTIRLEYYKKRKDHLVSQLEQECGILGNKVRFILAVIAGSLVVSNRKRGDLLVELHDAGYKHSIENTESNTDTSADVNSESEEMDQSVTATGSNETYSLSFLAKAYNYLLNMPLWSLTFERVESLRKELYAKEAELTQLKNTNPSTLWLNDLEALESALIDMEEQRIRDLEGQKSITPVKRGRKSRIQAKEPAGKKAPVNGNKRIVSSQASIGKAKKRKRDFDSDEDEEDDDPVLLSDDDSDDDFLSGSQSKKEKPSITSKIEKATEDVKVAKGRKPAVKKEAAASKTSDQPKLTSFLSKTTASKNVEAETSNLSFMERIKLREQEGSSNSSGSSLLASLLHKNGTTASSTTGQITSNQTSSTFSDDFRAKLDSYLALGRSKTITPSVVPTVTQPSPVTDPTTPSGTSSTVKSVTTKDTAGTNKDSQTHAPTRKRQLKTVSKRSATASSSQPDDSDSDANDAFDFADSDGEDSPVPIKKRKTTPKPGTAAGGKARGAAKQSTSVDTGNKQSAAGKSNALRAVVLDSDDDGDDILVSSQRSSRATARNKRYVDSESEESEVSIGSDDDDDFDFDEEE